MEFGAERIIRIGLRQAQNQPVYNPLYEHSELSSSDSNHTSPAHTPVTWHSNQLFNQLVGVSMDYYTGQMPLQGTTHKWDGVTRGSTYEEGRAALQLMDLSMRTRALGGDSSKQYNLSDRLTLVGSCIISDSTGERVISLFKQQASSYIAASKNNRYMPYDEAVKIGISLIKPHVPAATQAADAERAFLARLDKRYKPIAAAAQAANLLAATPEQLAAAQAAVDSAQTALAALGDATTQQAGEDAAAFAARQQAHSCSN